MKKLHPLITICALVALSSLWSCNDNNNPVNSPSITKFTAPGDTTIQIGGKISIETEVDNEGGVEYTWLVNNDKVANTKDYLFEPSTPGHYTISFIASAKNGYESRTITVLAMKYWGGFFIINEGNFGSTPGSINYFYPATATSDASLLTDIYAQSNPGKDLGLTAEYGTVWGDKIYVVSKGDAWSGNTNSKLYCINAYDMKLVSTIDVIPADFGYAYAFAGIDKEKGVLTTNKGAYIVNLGDNMTMGNLLAGSDAVDTSDPDAVACGAVAVAGNNIFVINQIEGIMVYSKTNFAYEGSMGMASVGFAKDKDGNLWAANTTELVKIETRLVPHALRIALPAGVEIHDSWISWNAGSLCASINENAIFFAQTGQFGGGNEIYKYVEGNDASLNAPFATGGSMDAFYGSALSVNPSTGDLVVNYVDPGFGAPQSKNRIVLYDSKTGAEKSRFVYPQDDYWYPAMTVYQK